MANSERGKKSGNVTYTIYDNVTSKEHRAWLDAKDHDLDHWGLGANPSSTSYNCTEIQYFHLSNLSFLSGRTLSRLTFC